jgi:hypothetical protein
MSNGNRQFLSSFELKISQRAVFCVVARGSFNSDHADVHIMRCKTASLSRLRPLALRDDVAEQANAAAVRLGERLVA